MYSCSAQLHRLLLNYLEVPYKTTWLSYPDIEPTFKELGIPPSTIRADGSGYYTCPTIAEHTPSGPTYITDSVIIADYLATTYPSPNKPPIFPKGTKAAIKLLISELHQKLLSHLVNLVLPETPAILDERGAEFFHRTRSAELGPLDQFYPAGPAREEVWSALKEYLDRLALICDQNDASDVFFIGSSITYADIYLVAIFMWTKAIPTDRDGPDIKCSWDRIKGLNGGRWARLMHVFDEYLQVN